MRICKQFSFDAAHYLPHHKGKCRDMHGHRWVLEVELEGPVRDDGMVIDFGDLKEMVNSEVITRLDHTLLNDTLKVPTCENLLVWIAEQLRAGIDAVSTLDQLARLRLYETPTSFAEIRLNPSGTQTSMPQSAGGFWLEELTGKVQS